MKKTLLSLGTIVSTIAPVASVIACGDGDVPGHEAPYSITISADAGTTTQANVLVDLKGFVSDSYIKEIKSRIAESIVAANKDTLKYKTIKICIGDQLNIDASSTLLINSLPLTDANKNDLNAVFNIINLQFDNFMNQIKNSKNFGQYFKKDIWENQHHQIDKVDQDEIKRTLLKLMSFNSTNPDLIDFKYRIISDKFVDFTITRTNVPASPELKFTAFSNRENENRDFVKGQYIHFIGIISKDFGINPGDDVWMTYKTSDPKTSGILSIRSGTANITFHSQIYKFTKFLLESNGYNNDLKYHYIENGNLKGFFTELESLGNSEAKLFGYGEQGRTAGINFGQHNTSLTDPNSLYDWKNTIDFDKKTFSLKFSTKPFDNYNQWIFGKDGKKLAVTPAGEWSMTIEGTYELNSASNAIETITSITTATATDGTNSIDLLESSVKVIAKGFLNFMNLFSLNK